MPFFMPGSGNLRRRKSARETEPESEEIERDAFCADQIDVPLNSSGADLTDLEPLPLEDAARRLELSEDDVKKQFRTGELRGFVQADRLFIYVPEILQDEDTATNTAMDKDRDDPATVIAYQKIEINRLIRANGELKTEKERLYRLLEREQVLRQGMQRAMERAWERLALVQGAEPLADTSDTESPAEAA